jgi:hypothetical protein
VVSVLIVLCDATLTLPQFAPSNGKRLCLDNLDGLKWPILIVGPSIAYLINHLHTADDLSKDGVLSIQVRSGRQSDEELAPVCAWPTVGHGEDALAGVNKRIIKLVLKAPAEDRLASTSRTGGIATLDHEVGNDAMEDDTIVFASVGEAGKVLTRLYRL